jgi:membrane-bound ClpP family serine protease
LAEAESKEIRDIRHQNVFGLKVTAAALLFTGLLLFLLSLFTVKGILWLRFISLLVSAAAWLPWKAARQIIGLTLNPGTDGKD